MTKFHVSPDGMARRCSAGSGENSRGCKYGYSETEHYETKEDAQLAYEDKQRGNSFRKLNKTSLSGGESDPVKVYRVGSMTAPKLVEQFSELQDIIKTLDSFKPSNRQGREGALFSTIDANSSTRWVKGLGYDKEKSINEITVNPDTTYIYNIDLYEKACRYVQRYREDKSRGELGEELENVYKDKIKSASEDYWNSAMTLTEFNNTVKDPYERKKYEILVAEEQIKNTRVIPPKVFIKKIFDNNYDKKVVNNVFFPNRAKKGLIYRECVLDKDDLIVLHDELLNNGFDKNDSEIFLKIYSDNAYNTDDISKEKGLTSCNESLKEFYNKFRKEKLKRNPDMDLIRFNNKTMKDENLVKDCSEIIKFVEVAEDFVKNKRISEL